MEQIIEVTLGRVVAKAFRDVQKHIGPADHANDIVNIMEDRIWGAGFKLAFPTSVAIDDCVAHNEGFSREVLGYRLVKIDAGAMFDGHMVDSAITLDFNKATKLVEATKDSLNAVINVAKAGMPVREIGQIIEDSLLADGFRPIAHLCGHGIGIGQIHAYPHIPNCHNNSVDILREGQVIAVEPLATSGTGEIYCKDMDGPIFTKDGSTVAHFEHTLIIHKGSCTVATDRY